MGSPGVTTDQSFLDETSERDSHAETSGATQAEQTHEMCCPRAVNASDTPTAAARGGRSGTNGNHQAPTTAAPRETAQTAPASFGDGCSGSETLESDHGTSFPGSAAPATTRNATSSEMTAARRPAGRRQTGSLEKSQCVPPHAPHPRR